MIDITIITTDDINNLLPENFELKLVCLNAKESLKMGFTTSEDKTWFCCITRNTVCEVCGESHAGPFFKGIGYNANEALRESLKRMREAGF